MNMADLRLKLSQWIRRFGRLSTTQIVLLAIGLVLAVLAFFFTRNTIDCWRLTTLEGLPVLSCSGSSQSGSTSTPQPGSTAAVATGFPTGIAPAATLPPPWDGASRVSILILGLDYRDIQSAASEAEVQGAPNSDTMMVVTIDPVTKTAGMISIPRDMWVNIPGFGYSKINSAYPTGEEAKLPGGGPGLAMKTVEDFLGIPIQYYAYMDFTTFINAINKLGGVNVCVPAPIVVSLYAEIGKADLKAGCQTLSGIVALGYARDRYTANGDVDRANRQQQVMMGIRDKVLDPKNFPILVAEAPALYQEFSSGISTNMSLSDALSLAVLLQQIPRSSIKQVVIDYTMMQDGKALMNGVEEDILQPYPDKIRAAVASVFGSGVESPLAKGTPTQLIQAEAATVLVINDSGVAGLAQHTSDYLKSQGMNVVNYGNPSDYPDQYVSPLPGRTILIVHSGKPYAMKYLESLMNFNTPDQIVFDFNPSAPADLVVALGQDWGSNNTLP
jgi:LCP family protein required for cell wall assembly